MDKTLDFLDGLVLPRLIYLVRGGFIFNNGDALYLVERNKLHPTGEHQLIDADYPIGANPGHKETTCFTDYGPGIVFA